jgi:hypothetical protein
MVDMANGSKIAVKTVVEAARSVEVGGGAVVDGGGACDEGDSGAVGGTPDITDQVDRISDSTGNFPQRVRM